jgi:hypothetical protein
VLAKSPSNMLVLNTHLDTLVAHLRYARTTADTQYEETVASARRAALGVLDLAPAEWLYRQIFRLVGLTMLPTGKAAALPLHVRALKRIAWRFVIPRLPALKTRYPRLVMPGGYVDRALSLRNWSHRYLGINAMDLARAARRLPADARLLQLASNAVRYALDSGIAEKWREQAADRYALGFLAEALCHLCSLEEEPTWRHHLAGLLFVMHDLALGFPPTTLGCNAETSVYEEQMPCPLATSRDIRVASFRGKRGGEMLILNTGNVTTEIAWTVAPPSTLRWTDGDGNATSPDAPLTPRAWRLGVSR